MVIDGSSSAQALSAFGVSLNATAHNVANVSTEGYQPQQVALADGPGGQGVQVAAVTTAQGGELGTGSVEAGGQMSSLTGSLAAGALNGVDVTREMVGLMQTERAFSANATMLRTVEQTTGHVLDLIA